MPDAPHKADPIAGVSALQHGPRPLPLFLDMLRSETAAEPQRRARALEGLRRYQQAARPNREGRDAPVRDTSGGTMLREHGGSGPPVMLIPSLINPATILDLTPDVSLAAALVAQGFRVLSIDWGTPEPGSTLDVAGHVAERLVPLIARLGESVRLVGYCLGGTMALAAATLAPAARVATIAAPWRFAGYGEAARTAMAEVWTRVAPACARLGVVPIEVLQAGFWRLDPARTIAKYEAVAATEPGSPAEAAFVALEDWANAGAPLTHAAGAELFERFIGEDVPGEGGWRVGGRAIDPAALPCPAIEFVSLSDRIVPAATAIGLAERRDLRSGHVGMVVGRGRGALIEPLAAWLKQP